MTLRKLALSLTLLGSVSLTQAADLLEVYRAARNYDAGYAAAGATRDAEREKAPQARAGLPPSIGLAASTTRNRVESTPRAGGLASDAEYNSNGWTISLLAKLAGLPPEYPEPAIRYPGQTGQHAIVAAPGILAEEDLAAINTLLKR